MSLTKLLFLILWVNLGYLVYLIWTNTGEEPGIYYGRYPVSDLIDTKINQPQSTEGQKHEDLFLQGTEENAEGFGQHGLIAEEHLNQGYNQKQTQIDPPESKDGNQQVLHHTEDDPHIHSDVLPQHVGVIDSQEKNQYQLDINNNPSVNHKTKALEYYLMIFMTKYKHRLCQGLKRPRAEDVPKINKKWQYFMVNRTRTNLVAMYYDNRSPVSGPCLHGFAALVCPIGELTQAVDYHVLLWYEGVEFPLPVKCWTKTKVFDFNWWNTDNMTHGVTEFRCLLPGHELIPTHVSLSDKRCHLQANLLEVVQPDPPVNGKRQEVSACVKCLFGNLTESYAPFLVSWFESMKLFGMPEIYMDQDIIDMAPVVARIFEHYKDIKFLHMNKFPNNLYETAVPRVDNPLSQSVVMSVSNDCFYRNMDKYNYILHIDFDEILVPRRHNTYAELIREFLQTNTTRANSSCLTARSAPFYRYLEKGNPQAPDYAPILQYTYRMPPIIPGQDGIIPSSSGVRKAFISTRSCTTLYIHGCHGWVPGYTGEPRSFFPVEDVLVHHYRQTCKYNPQNSGVCPPNDYHEINDTILWDKFGPTLSDSIRGVLLKVGYLNDK